MHVGVAAALAGEDQAVAGGVGARSAPSVQLPGIAADTCWTVEQRLGVSGSGGGGGGVSCLLRPRALPSRMPLDARPGGRRTRRSPASRDDQDRGDRGRDAHGRVRAAARRAGPHARSRAAASGPTPARARAPRARLGSRWTGPRGARANCAVAVCSSRSAWRAVRPTSRAMSVDRERGQVGEQQHLALRGRTACRARRAWPGSRRRCPSARCHQRAVCRRWARRPGQRAHPVLGVLEPRDLAPVVPGHDEASRTARCGGGQVAGERVASGGAVAPGRPCRRRRSLRTPEFERGSVLGMTVPR